MNIAFRKPWTPEAFFAWQGHGEGRYEFDGQQPVPMTGGSIVHAMIMRNLHAALRSGLRGTPCQALGPDAGVATIGQAVRYPDAVVTCARLVLSACTVPAPVAVFEIVSPSSERTDRIIKPREYAGVPSIRSYVILESTSPGLTLLERQAGEDPWTATTLASEDDILHLPALGIDIRLGEFYRDIDFAEAGAE